jgi:hypothetical protein
MLIRFTDGQVTVFLWGVIAVILVIILSDEIREDK